MLDSPACYDELGMLILQFNHMGFKINELNGLTRGEAGTAKLMVPVRRYKTLQLQKHLQIEKEVKQYAVAEKDVRCSKREKQLPDARKWFLKFPGGKLKGGIALNKKYLAKGGLKRLDMRTVFAIIV